MLPLVYRLASLPFPFLGEDSTTTESCGRHGLSRLFFGGFKSLGPLSVSLVLECGSGISSLEV